MTGARPLYSLWVSFRSNKGPFQSSYDPYPKDKFATDEEAIDWLRGMRDGMGPDYDITLLKHGEAMNVPDLPDIAEAEVDGAPSASPDP